MNQPVPLFPFRMPTGSEHHTPQILVQAVLEAMRDAVVIVDMEGNIVYVNHAALSMLQTSTEELLGQPFSQVIGIRNDQQPLDAQAVVHRWEIGQPIYDSARHLLLERADGDSVPIEDYAAPIRLHDESMMGAVIVFKDVSDRRHAQHVLDLSGRMFHELFNFAPDAMLIADSGGNIVLANAQARYLFGYRESIEGLSLHALIPECLAYTRFIPDEPMNTIDAVGIEMTCRTAQDESFPGEVSLGHLNTPQRRLLMAVIRDVRQRKEYEARLYYQASHDLLTGLANRTHVLEHLQTILLQARHEVPSAALFFIDLDNFTDINDTLGHEIGDQLLCEMGRRLAGQLHECDVLARVGGDEFAVVRHGVGNRAELEEMGVRLLRTIMLPWDKDGRRLQVSGSIGICLYPVDGEEPLALLRNADIAMYRAKERGGNAYAFYQHEMYVSQRDRMELSSAMHLALERGEFVLEYQPKLDLRSGHVSGMEALVRWRHPTRGLLAPDSFIPVAEDCGMIIDIGAWVIEETCRQIAEWQTLGMWPVRVAINISAAQFRNDDLYSRITHALETHDVAPSLLEIEITESMMLHDPVEALDIFRALREYGVDIAIDDFGTGYSSFAYLRRFPARCLKIDKSFTDDLRHNASNIEVIRAIVAVAHHLELRVTAEGVETLEQLQLLGASGCHEIQGYYFSRPLSPDAIFAFVQDRNRKHPIYAVLG
jgi:diguanylate cyclase